MIYGITLAVLGFLAIPSLVLSKRPDAQKFYDKLAPIQGWLGVIFAIIGVIGLVSSILRIGQLADAPIAWITSLAVSLLEAALGFILGYSLITKYVLKGEKGERVFKKLQPVQGSLGIIAIILGIWSIIAWFIW